MEGCHFTHTLTHTATCTSWCVWFSTQARLQQDCLNTSLISLCIHQHWPESLGKQWSWCPRPLRTRPSHWDGWNCVLSRSQTFWNRDILKDLLNETWFFFLILKVMREKRMWRTCPAWCWVVRWRWKDPPRSACCPLSEWLFLRSEGFGSRQLRSLRAPLGSRRQRPFPRLPSFWRCLRCWTGCCCDCSPPRCCWSRWGKLSVAGGCWAWMRGRHLCPGLETGRETSDSGFTPAVSWP